MYSTYSTVGISISNVYNRGKCNEHQGCMYIETRDKPTVLYLVYDECATNELFLCAMSEKVNMTPLFRCRPIPHISLVNEKNS